MDGAKGIDTPMATNSKLDRDEKGKDIKVDRKNSKCTIFTDVVIRRS